MTYISTYISVELGCVAALLELWQHDFGVRLALVGEHVATGMPVQWHYPGIDGVDSRPIMADADGTLYTVMPDAALRQTGDVTGYIYIFDAVSGRTRYTINVTVKPRPSTEDDHSEDDTTYIGQLVERAEGAVEQAEAAQQGAKAAEGQAEDHAGDAEQSKLVAAQALADLLAMMGTDIASLVGGKIPLSQIPATATQEIYTVASEDELTGLTAQRGDLAELIEEVNGEQTITKTWQCLGDPTILESWVVWGTSYAVQAGSATLADTAANSEMVNGHRVVHFDSIAELEAAVKIPGTLYYAPYDEE